MKKNFLMKLTTLALFSLLLSACGSNFVMMAVSSREVRAKYTVTDEQNGVVVSQGLTPQTLPIPITKRGNERFRVDITHPETSEVYSETVEAKLTLEGWALTKRLVEAPF